MNLRDLPEIQFCETNAAAVEREIFQRYEQAVGGALYPGAPERLFLEGVAYGVALERFNIDYAGKMNLLRYSQGDYLEHIGAMVRTERLGEQSARTTLRFCLQRELDFSVVIPQGTRAAAGGSLVFATEAEAIIEPGRLSVDVLAICQTAGAKGNGLVAGQINKMIDPVAYVASAANTTLSLGGTDAESDENLRLRTQLAPESFSTCGPGDAYRWWAMNVSQDIIDVGVWSPQEGRVHLAPLMAGGKMPNAEIRAAVSAAVNDERVRPLTDTVVVQAPESVEYSVAGTYYLRNSYAARAAAIQAETEAALQAFLTWQAAKLGRAVNPSELAGRIQSIEGIHRVEITEPGYLALDPWQAAKAVGGELNYGGLAGE